MGLQQVRLNLSHVLGRVICCLGLTVTLGVTGAQVPSASQASPAPSRPHLGANPTESPDPFNSAASPRIEKMREDERHKKLMSDAQRLIALTGELKAELDKASKDELSLDVVRKAAEIEKLAHDVKERMKS